MNVTTANNSVELKIETEVQHLRTFVKEELNELRKQIATSRTIPQPSTCSGSCCTTSAIYVDSAQAHASQELMPNNANVREQASAVRPIGETSGMNLVQSTAFKAGDSITRILSSKRMTDNNLKVNIKTYSGGRIRTVESSIIKMA